MRKLRNLTFRVLYEIGQLVTSAFRITASVIQITVTGWALLLAMILICYPAADIREGIKSIDALIVLLKSTLEISIALSLIAVMYRKLLSL